VDKLVNKLIVPAAALLLLLILFSLNYALILAAVTFAVGLAIAGPAHWFKWTITYLAASTLLGAIAGYFFRQVPEGVVGGLIMCALVPLVPAFLLWLAHLINARSNKAR
jgi:hypothetical protein